MRRDPWPAPKIFATPASPSPALSKSARDFEALSANPNESAASTVIAHDPRSSDSGTRVANAPFASVANPASPNALPRKFAFTKFGHAGEEAVERLDVFRVLDLALYELNRGDA